MTHDPHRLATAEQIMNGNNPFEKVDTPLGTMERWRAEAMLIGTTGGMKSVFESIRADAAAQAARADEAEARTTLIRHVCDKIADFEKRFDALEARLTEAEDRRRADEACKAKFDEEIELPPDLHEKQASTPPAKIENDTPTPSADPEPPFDLEGGSEFPDPELSKPPVVAQPVAISLNKE